MNWSDLFPVLDDESVNAYRTEASRAEKASLAAHFEIEEVFNRRPADHVVATSLFWKPIRQKERDYPKPSRKVMQKPHAHGLSSRFVNPWDHYVVPLLETAGVLQSKRPEITLRVYLANDLSFLVEELVSVGCEVCLMRSSSLRHNPGAMWRFLAMEEEGLVTMCDSDRAEDVLHHVERTELLATGNLKHWRTPYFPGKGAGNYGCPSRYRSINACHFGSLSPLPIRRLAEAFLWNVAQGRIRTTVNPGTLEIPIYGCDWPDYGFDEYFLNTAIFPRMARNGILTLLYRRDWTHSYWLALDLQFCMKCHPESESLHWGDPWPDEGRTFEPTAADLTRIRERLVNGTRPVISICVSLKNRSRIVAGDDTLELFPNCVRSLAPLARSHGPVELLVADFQSDDWPLAQWLVESAEPMTVQVIPMEGAFSKGRGLNAAVEAAQSDRLLLLDADMRVSEGAFLAGLDSLSKGRAFFPIIMGLDREGNDVGWWGEGTGIAFVPKAIFEKVGGIAEFQSWGGEDDLFYEAVTSLIPIDRGKIEGMVHQWHPDHCRHEHYRGGRWEDFDKLTGKTGQEPP